VGVIPLTVTQQSATTTFRSRGAAKGGESFRYRASNYGGVLSVFVCSSKIKFLVGETKVWPQLVFGSQFCLPFPPKTKERTPFSITFATNLHPTMFKNMRPDRTNCSKIRVQTCNIYAFGVKKSNFKKGHRNKSILGTKKINEDGGLEVKLRIR